MIDQFDERLQDWITSVVQGASVSLFPPDGEREGRGVGLYLLEVTQAPPPSTVKRPPLQLALRYLITAWSDKPQQAHQMLVQLIFAAMENPDFQVELDPIPITVWTAFKGPPQPSFILRVPLRQERPEIHTAVVRHPLKIEASPIVGLHGLLLGPDDVPLSNCTVEIPALHISANTDYRGRFHFPGVPEKGTKRLLVKAKGRQLSIESDQNFPDSETPLVVHFSSLEE